MLKINQILSKVALTIVAVLCGVPGLANAQQLFATTLTLDSVSTKQVIRGVTLGAVELHYLVGDRDSFQNRCMGFGSVEPDHVLKVSSNIKTLNLQVISKNQDTTIVVKGNGKVYCADDSSLGKDAGITLSDLKSGDYSLWVGSFEAQQKIPYSLTIQ